MGKRKSPRRSDNRALADPGDKSYDHENTSGHEGGERARHPKAHRDLEDAEIVIHPGGPMLLAKFIRVQLFYAERTFDRRTECFKECFVRDRSLIRCEG